MVKPEISAIRRGQFAILANLRVTVFPSVIERKDVMKYLPDLIITGAFTALSFEFAALYGELASGLFDQVSYELEQALSKA